MWALRIFHLKNNLHAIVAGLCVCYACSCWCTHAVSVTRVRENRFLPTGDTKENCCQLPRSCWPTTICAQTFLWRNIITCIEVSFIIVIVSKKSSKKFSKKYSKKYSTFWVLFWVLKKVLKKVLLLNIAQKSAQKSAQKRDKLLKWDKFAQKSAQKSQIYSFLSRILKKVL